MAPENIVDLPSYKVVFFFSSKAVNVWPEATATAATAATEETRSLEIGKDNLMAAVTCWRVYQSSWPGWDRAGPRIAKGQGFTVVDQWGNSGILKWRYCTRYIFPLGWVGSRLTFPCDAWCWREEWLLLLDGCAASKEKNVCQLLFMHCNY